MEALYVTWIPTSFYEGLSFTFMLSLHLLSLCTYFESMVAILSSMCIVPRLVDWCITLILLVLKLFVSSHPYELWRCPMHLCFATLWGTRWIPFLLYFLYVKQTNIFQSIVIHESFVCTFSCSNIVAISYCYNYIFMLC